METVLVAGGAGYVGSHLSFFLKEQGYKVIIIDNYRYGQSFRPSWAEVISCSIVPNNELVSLLSKENIVALFHCAGLIEVGESCAKPLKYYSENIHITCTLLDWCIQLSIPHFIFSSSCSVYGNTEESFIDEEHALNPENPYAHSKYFCEKIIKEVCAKNNIDYAILRYFNVAGAFVEQGLGEMHVPETHVIPLLCQAAAQNISFSLYGTEYQTPDGTAIRDYIHVNDLARAHLSALSYMKKTALSSVLNIGNGKGHSVLDLIKTAEEVTGKNIKIKRDKARSGDAPCLVAHSLKSHALLNWECRQSSLEEIIESSWKFLISHSFFLFFLFSSCAPFFSTFHEVREGKLYRSGQLSTKKLRRCIEKYKIASVLNLRGYSPHKNWWVQEVITCNLLGARHVDVSLSARYFPEPGELIKLLWYFRTLPHPLLIHCKGGADRTGTACTLWLLEQGECLCTALKQLSPSYRHFPFLFPSQRSFVYLWHEHRWQYLCFIDPLFMEKSLQEMSAPFSRQINRKKKGLC